MGRRSLDRDLVGHVLDAIKKALGHLSRIKLEAGQSARLDESQLMLLYTRIRRVQDYLQLSSATGENLIEVDLTDIDDDLLASCLLMVIGDGEVRGIRRGVATGKPSEWNRELAMTLASLAIEFANRQIEPLPGVSPAHGKSILVQRVAKEVDLKHSAERELSSRFETRTAAPAMAAVSELEKSINEEVGFKEGIKPERYDYKELHARAVSASPQSSSSPHSIVKPDPQPEAKPVVQRDVYDSSEEEGDDDTPMAMEEGFLLDPNRIRDPRLRQMMVEDMRGMRRCRRAHDYRMASVHLCAVLEQVTLEYAMPRATELGLVGPIDSWRIPVLLVQLLGDDLDEDDRSLLRQILTSRNLLISAVQLRNPSDVTADSFMGMLQLVRQMLACMSMKANP